MNVENDELVSAIHDKVKQLNSDDRRAQMHTLEDYINERERAAGEKARAEGEKIGEAIGRSEGSIEIARKMLAKGIDRDIIIEVTGISEDDLRKL